MHPQRHGCQVVEFRSCSPPSRPTSARHLRFNFLVGLLDGGAFGLGMGFGSFAAIIPLFVHHLTNSALLIGLVPAIHNMGWQLPQLLTAGWISRLSRYKPLTLAMTVHERLPFLGLAILAFCAARVNQVHHPGPDIPNASVAGLRRGHGGQPMDKSRLQGDPPGAARDILWGTIGRLQWSGGRERHRCQRHPDRRDRASSIQHMLRADIPVHGALIRVSGVHSRAGTATAAAIRRSASRLCARITQDPAARSQFPHVPRGARPESVCRDGLCLLCDLRGQGVWHERCSCGGRWWHSS